jgi:hypothetical protein
MTMGERSRRISPSAEMSDLMLSRQVVLLETAGYVHVEKRRVSRRPRTSLSPSDEGTAAYDRHVAALRAIAGLTD